MSAPVVRLLLEQGHEVTCITRGNANLPDGARAPTGDRDNREWLVPAMQAA